VYRVEHRYTNRGPCYNEFSDYDPIFLKNGQLAVNIPMPFNSEYHVHGVTYHVAGASLEDMLVWFNKSNINELRIKGFVLREFETDSVFEIEGHLKFNRKESKKVIELDIEILNK